MSVSVAKHEVRRWSSVALFMKGKGKGAYYKAKYGGGGRGGYGGKGSDWGGGYGAGDGGDWGGSPSSKRKAPAVAGSSELADALIRLDGKPYGAYHDVVGEWVMDGSKASGSYWSVFIDRVQSDPYAPPSSIRVRISMSLASFPADLWDKPVRNMALQDFLTRHFHGVITGAGLSESAGGGGWGGSKGGDLRVEKVGQNVMPRSTLLVSKNHVEARCTLALPARGRTIEGHRAATVIVGLTETVRESLYWDKVNQKACRQHVDSVEDQEWLRGSLASRGLIAFVPNGAILPRRSGVDDRPMPDKEGNNLVKFESPEAMRVTVSLPRSGRTIEGMGIKKGVTLIVGGGFHGKSTLLEALQVGIYSKIPGDGREFVSVDPNAVKIRAEDGRFVKGVNISPFINNLPFGKDTTNFSTEDASGSTSQAANIIEALEVGATTLLVDEDTCATNFMIRDSRMCQLVSQDKEPITPFLWRVRPLFEEHGVSSIIVCGGCGDYFSVADTVVMMDQYKPKDVTSSARSLAGPLSFVDAASRVKFSVGESKRRPVKASLAPDHYKVQSKSLRCIQYGNNEIELSNVEQLVETLQGRAIADTIQTIAKGGGIKGRDLASIVQEIHDKMEVSCMVHHWGEEGPGLDMVSQNAYPVGYYSMVRKFEIAAAISRLRTLRLE